MTRQRLIILSRSSIRSSWSRSFSSVHPILSDGLKKRTLSAGANGLSAGCHHDFRRITSCNHATAFSTRLRNAPLRFQSTAAAVVATDEEEESPPRGRPFLLADIGEGIKEVEVLQWFVKAHDTVQQFDKICEVQSDKATVEITSRYDGEILQLACGTGEMVQVGSPLLYFKSDNDGFVQEEVKVAVASESTMPLEALNVPQKTEPRYTPLLASQSHVAAEDDNDDFVAGSHHKFQASPAVRKLVKEYQLDLASIRGSGPAGRLLKMDVITYLKEQGRYKDNATDTKHMSPSATLETRQDEHSSLEDPVLHPIRGYHRLMVSSMTEALQIPHMGLSEEVQVDALMQCRKELKELHPDKPWSLLTLFLKACSLALTEHPLVNAVIARKDDNDTSSITHLELLPNHNLGIAMDTPRGLVVPVIRNCQLKSLTEIQDDLDRLKSAASSFQLATEDLQTPTLTLSNIGSTGVGTVLSPIIVPPQLVTGAFGRIQRLPRFDAEGKVQAASIMHVSWAGDHRVLDGATLARFHNTFGQYVEHPVSMLAHLR